MKLEKQELSIDQQKTLLETLKKRFEEHEHRHQTIAWNSVRMRLEANAEKLWSLHEMEVTGGEPDVVGAYSSGEFIFYDCSAESHKDRRNLCYDRKALEARKEHKPETSAMDMAIFMGADILSEEQYRELQTLGSFDLKTSSWVKTPSSIRDLGGALFCDRRYDTVFLYHNGAESYYSSRGFRACLIV